MKRFLCLTTLSFLLASCIWFGEPPHGPGPGPGPGRSDQYYAAEYANAQKLMKPAYTMAWFYDYYHAKESQDSYIIHFYGGDDKLKYSLSFVPNKRTSIVGEHRLGENKLTWLEMHNSDSTVIISRDGYFIIRHTGTEIIMDKLTGDWGCLPRYSFYGYATLTDGTKVKWDFEQPVSAVDSYLYEFVFSTYGNPTEEQLGQAVIILQD